MSYERLTHYRVTPDYKHECAEPNDGVRNGDIYNRLAELEDGIENGDVLQLPCLTEVISNYSGKEFITYQLIYKDSTGLISTQIYSKDKLIEAREELRKLKEEQANSDSNRAE